MIILIAFLLLGCSGLQAMTRKGLLPSAQIVQVDDFFCLYCRQNNILVPIQQRGARLQDSADHLYLSWIRKKPRSKL